MQGDATCIYSHNQDSVRYSSQWKKQLDFDGKLGTQACQEKKNIAEDAKEDKRKLQRNSYECAVRRCEEGEVGICSDREFLEN